ncbi:RpiB/LacA/LacB family sugar-phosphate isomerase [Brevibacillus choshinensis]|uniref:RpiB/LacA/LacB family sugar-phosphate isomerase n=1 Tax=Brevibacillus choshinensis TaxID=54911 RepID=A0ABX7FL03_BRECH|nr:RpiB/LacA/LacB family sugar-phosphate isomerase [Brevibacillus choshinensis]QRG66428.1 RpiB/LacA/LacB family sugar-phosphate isomerase [Brevibacillus choshinensis]
MKIALASDRGGFALKQYLLEKLAADLVAIHDFGCTDPMSDDYAIGYPDYAEMVGKAVASGNVDRGILVCGTGIGMSIAANKVRGVRCALVHDTFSAEQTRLYNDSNVLALGEMMIGRALGYEIVKTWLRTPFMGNMNRLEKIKELEEA